jgi:hypothetical protein
MSLVTLHPLALQTAYSDLKERARTVEDFFAGTPGSVVVRTVKNREFFYHQYYDALGAKVADYLGPAEDPAAIVLADATRERIAMAAALAAEGRVLARAGYVRVDAKTFAVLAAIASAGLFRAGAVLVGSHAFGVLLNELGVRAVGFATQDVDVARPRPLRLPSGATLAGILGASRVPLVPVPGFDRRRSVTSYKAKGRDPFRVDLIAPTAGSTPSVTEVPELAAHATTLPGLAPLVARPLVAVALGREGAVAVTVPRPEALAWHKMIVSRERTARADKKTKDEHQAAVLVAALAGSEPAALEEAWGELPSAMRKKARDALPAVRAKLVAAKESRAVEVLDGVVL